MAFSAENISKNSVNAKVSIGQAVSADRGSAGFCIRLGKVSATITIVLSRIREERLKRLDKKRFGRDSGIQQ